MVTQNNDMQSGICERIQMGITYYFALGNLFRSRLKNPNKYGADTVDSNIWVTMLSFEKDRKTKTEDF